MGWGSIVAAVSSWQEVLPLHLTNTHSPRRCNVHQRQRTHCNAHAATHTLQRTHCNVHTAVYTVHQRQRTQCNASVSHAPYVRHSAAGWCSVAAFFCSSGEVLCPSLVCILSLSPHCTARFHWIRHNLLEIFL